MQCNACHVGVSGEERVEHYNSEWHRYNIKRKCVSLGPVTRQFFEAKVDQLKAAQAVQVKCDPCNLVCKDMKALQRHIKTRKHLSKIEYLAKQATIQKVEDEAVPTLVEAKNEVVVDEEGKEETAPRKLLQVTSKNVRESKIDESDEESDEEELEDDVYGEPIPLKHCLFCPDIHDTLEESVDHMLKVHGFFIPFIEHLVYLEELLEWVGGKIGVGNLCLYCNKATCRDLKSLQKHMKDKSHCKLNLQLETDQEIENFYLFPGEEYTNETTEGEQLEEPAMQTVKPFKSEKYDTERYKKVHEGKMVVHSGKHAGPNDVSEVNEHGELVFTSGFIAGHRQHQRYYMQKKRPEITRDAILIRKVMSTYRALQLDGFDHKSGKYLWNERTKEGQKRRNMERWKHEFRHSEVNPRMQLYTKRLM